MHSNLALNLLFNLVTLRSPRKVGGMSATSSNGPTDCDLACQARLLQNVSLTFAFTIPQLPHRLRWPVTNAYLLCRIADTIEDEPALSPAQKQAFLDRFVTMIAGREDATSFARELGALLSSSTTESERDLVASCNRVVRITASLNSCQRAAIVRCLRIMSRGMMEFQKTPAPVGLTDLSCLNRYCYCVAGVVGEMLTELFCDYSVEVNRQKKGLLALSVAYAQGLQMTNILKDLWDDQRRGVCWLPRDVFKGVRFRVGSAVPRRGRSKVPQGFLRAGGNHRWACSGMDCGTFCSFPPTKPVSADICYGAWACRCSCYGPFTGHLLSARAGISNCRD